MIIPISHTRQSRALSIDRYAPNIWPLKVTSDLGHDLWPQSKVNDNKQWCPYTIFREWNARSRFRLKNRVMCLEAWQIPFTSTLAIDILLNFRGFYHLHIIMKRIPLYSSWNSANFDSWTISVGQANPEIPPPSHIATQISHHIYTDLKDNQKSAKNCGIPRIRGGFHCLDFKHLTTTFWPTALTYNPSQGSKWVSTKKSEIV